MYKLFSKTLSSLIIKKKCIHLPTEREKKHNMQKIVTYNKQLNANGSVTTGQPLVDIKHARASPSYIIILYTRNFGSNHQFIATTANDCCHLMPI